MHVSHGLVPIYCCIYIYNDIQYKGVRFVESKDLDKGVRDLICSL